MPPELLYEMERVDLTKVVADREAIRKVNPQRFEMEQLDAIVFLDTTIQIVVGYKDVRSDEFWIRGHMPDYPLMPGVMMCEAAAQLCSYYSVLHIPFDGDFIGFSGMDDVRFRGTVKPGDRLILVSKAQRYNRRQMVFNVQGFVQDKMVFHGDIIGVPLKRREG